MSPDEIARLVSAAEPELNLAGHEKLFVDGIERARHAWPALTVSTEDMVVAMARGVRGAGDPVAALRELVVEDLYLARACVAGTPAALEAFAATCGAALAGSLRAMGLADDVMADVTQEVHAKLFVAVNGPPKIATYSGRATLRGWVRTIATRSAVDRLRKPSPESAPDEVFDALPDAGTGPELDHFRARYTTEFKQAFEVALESLDVRERNLLRHHFVDNLVLEDIGALYGVHKTTAFRWLESARDKLSKRTRNEFQNRVHLPPSEMDSVLRMVQSNLELSLSRVLV